MTSRNGMNESATLNENVFGEQPHISELQKTIEATLAQLYPQGVHNPKIQEALCRIGSISDTLTTLTGETRSGIVNLYTETVVSRHLGKCSNQMTILEAHQRGRIANILGASNDENYSKVV